ncbi:MAG TPA: PilZ domain-containing protein [Candidatus Udaeobacter sp.]|nr:PilZ domain-containing protein [Candidatus Udaeobacter sp.]
MTLKTDRRTQHRKRPLSLVYVELPPANGGMMRDLSEQGFSLRAMTPVSPSEKIQYSFVLDSSARIEGDAIVLRVEDGGRVAALEFAGMPPHCRDQIRRWLDKFDEPISPDSEPAQPAASKHASLTELRTQIRAPKAPSQPPPVKAIPPSAPEPFPPPPVQPAEIVPPQSIVSAPPNPEPPSSPLSAAAEATPLPSPVVADTPPAPIVMALPKLAPLPPQEPPPPPPPQAHLTVEQQDGPPLPPLLKLSSVRPGPLPAELSGEPDDSGEAPKLVTEPPEGTPLTLPKPAPPAAMEIPFAEPAPAPPVVRRRAPPALEPLSSFEGETDSDTPGWMDRFTLERAVGIMLFLTLLAGSYVYHGELGQALIWLGHQIAGDESPENSKFIRPEVPSASHSAPEPTPAARSLEPPAPVIQHSSATTEPTSGNLPAASEKTPSPQLKGGSPGSLVPLTQVTRPPAPTASGDNSVEPGQPEYLQALQILRSPSKSSEVPAAIQLLWAAVEKGNIGAEIDLAELFRTGRGVAKNCDQTRILLSAAVRKGSAEARKRLEALQRQGCNN